MNATPTPETDALHEQRREIHSAYFMMVSNARRLERERNEAREQRTKAVEKYQASIKEMHEVGMQRDRLAGAIRQHQETLAMRPDYADHKLWDTLATLNQPEP